MTVSARADAVQRDEIKALKRKVRDLEATNENLKAASIIFARQLDPRHRAQSSPSIIRKRIRRMILHIRHDSYPFRDSIAFFERGA
jgi:hypothetical protein